MLRVCQLLEILFNDPLLLSTPLLMNLFIVQMIDLVGFVELIPLPLISDSRWILKVQPVMRIVIGYIHLQPVIVSEHVNIDACKLMILIILRH